VILPLSFEEQHLYNMLFDETRRQLDSLVSKGDTIRCNILFRAMLRMRRLCNLGTFSPVETSTDLLRKLDSEIKCVRCSATDDDTLMLLANYLFCPDCGRQLDLASPLPNPVDNQGSDAENSCEKASTIREVAQVPSAKITHLPLGGYSTKLAAVVQNVVSKGPEAKK
jgi:hypothetical protein